MQGINVLALFCEDIREEKDNVLTLIGIMPDNVNLENPSNTPPEGGGTKRMLSKLSIYTRINFDPNLDIGVPEVCLVLPNNEIINMGNIDPTLVAKAQAEAQEKGALLAGIISRAAIWGFAPPENESIKVEVTINGEKYLAGALRFQSPQSATSSTE